VKGLVLRMCEYCDGEKNLSESEVLASVFRNGLLKMSAYGDEYSSCIEINYCPMCGVKLGGDDE